MTTREILHAAAAEYEEYSAPTKNFAPNRRPRLRFEVKDFADGSSVIVTYDPEDGGQIWSEPFWH